MRLVLLRYCTIECLSSYLIDSSVLVEPRVIFIFSIFGSVRVQEAKFSLSLSLSPLVIIDDTRDGDESATAFCSHCSAVYFQDLWAYLPATMSWCTSLSSRSVRLRAYCAP